MNSGRSISKRLVFVTGFGFSELLDDDFGSGAAADGPPEAGAEAAEPLVEKG